MCDKTKVGPVGEDSSKQGRFVARRVARPQMREAVGKAGPAIHVREHLGDAHPREKPLQPRRQHARGVRSDRLGSGDVELALLDLDAIELLACRTAGNIVQLVMQQRGTRRRIARRICLAADSVGRSQGVGR